MGDGGLFSLGLLPGLLGLAGDLVNFGESPLLCLDGDAAVARWQPREVNIKNCARGFGESGCLAEFLEALRDGVEGEPLQLLKNRRHVAFGVIILEDDSTDGFAMQHIEGRDLVELGRCSAWHKALSSEGLRRPWSCLWRVGLGLRPRHAGGPFSGCAWRNNQRPVSL